MTKNSLLFAVGVVTCAALAGIAAAAGTGPMIVVAVLATIVTPIAIGFLGARQNLIAYVLLWGALVVSIGIKAPRRDGASVLSQGITLTNSVPLLVLVASLIAALLLTKVRLVPLRRTETLFVAFVAYAMASSIWSISPIHSFLRSAALAVTAFALIVLARISIQANFEPLFSLFIVVQITIGAALLGLLLDPQAAMAPIPGSSRPIERLKGLIPYVHPNALAFLASVGIVLIVARVGPSWLNTHPMWRLCLIVINFSVILATRTRSALAYLVVAGLAAILFEPKLRKRAIILIPMLLCCAFLILQIFGGTIGAFVARDQSATELTSLTGRLIEWRYVLHTAAENLLLGNGYYTGRRFAGSTSLRGSANTTSDNAWLDVVLDLGLLGLVLVAAIVIHGLRQLRTLQMMKSPGHRVALILYLICFIASLVNPSLNETNFWMITWAWLILGVAAPENAGLITTRMAPGLRPQPSVHALRTNSGHRFR